MVGVEGFEPQSIVPAQCDTKNRGFDTKNSRLFFIKVVGVKGFEP
jgi:hypothetical protein